MMNFFAPIRRVKEMYAYRHEPENLRPLAELYWRTLLVVVGIGVVIVLIFAASVFWGVLSALGNPTLKPVKQLEVLDRAELQNTLRLIEARSLEFEATKTAPTPVVDPSR